MKNYKLTPTSTSRNFKQYLYAYSYRPDYAKFYKPSTFSSLPQNSTPDPFVCSIEIICDLPKYKLMSPIECSVLRDEDGSYLVECPSLNLYSSGVSRQEAVENCKENIVSLYEDLMENDAFSDDWIEIKKALRNIIVE